MLNKVCIPVIRATE